MEEFYETDHEVSTTKKLELKKSVAHKCVEQAIKDLEGVLEGIKEEELLDWLHRNEAADPFMDQDYAGLETLLHRAKRYVEVAQKRVEIVTTMIFAQQYGGSFVVGLNWVDDEMMGNDIPSPW